LRLTEFIARAGVLWPLPTTEYVKTKEVVPEPLVKEAEAPLLKESVGPPVTVAASGICKVIVTVPPASTSVEFVESV
jgi:hypothetical protein